MWDEARRRSTSSGSRLMDLSGQWHAIWQTTVEGQPNINTEMVTITQSGTELVLQNEAKSLENPLGGYLWRSDAALVDNQYVLGSYAATEPRVSSRGTLYFVVNRSGTYLIGKWVGCNLDSNFTWGFGVLAQDKSTGMKKLRTLLRMAEDDPHRSPSAGAGVHLITSRTSEGATMSRRDNHD